MFGLILVFIVFCVILIYVIRCMQGHGGFMCKAWAWAF